MHILTWCDICRQSGHFIHLAMNKHKHLYSESIKESIIQLWTMHHTKNQDWKTIEMVPSLHSATRGYKQLSLLWLNYFWYLCATIIPNTNHYIHLTLFKLGSLWKEILSPHSGVSWFSLFSPCNSHIVSTDACVHYCSPGRTSWVLFQ